MTTHCEDTGLVHVQFSYADDVDTVIVMEELVCSYEWDDWDVIYIPYGGLPSEPSPDKIDPRGFGGVW